MKKTLTTLGLFLLILTANAQITLEHTFTTNKNPIYFTSGNRAATYSSGNVCFSDLDYEAGKVTLYKEDYSVYKVVTIPISTAYSYLYLVSDKLFNTDDAIEFVIQTVTYEPDRAIYSTKAYNENGEVIKDFGNRASYTLFIRNGKYKLLVSSIKVAGSNYTTDIYSLPGIPDNISTSKVAVMEAEPAYPNPAKSSITLPYSLPVGRSGIMSISDVTGRLIDKKVVDAASDHILLDVASYRSGIYVYECNGISSRFVVE